MLHASFTPITLYFVYTLWHFYAFSGTNLFLCFRKVTQEIFSELDETKPEVPIFPDTRRSPKQRRMRSRRWPHHLVARVHPWTCHPMVWGPWVPSDIAPPPIKSLRHENPKKIGIFPDKVPQRRRSRRPILRDRSLYSGTLRDGELPPEPSPSTPPPSSSSLLSPMMRRD
jgi:hypothetical protein